MLPHNFLVPILAGILASKLFNFSEHKSLLDDIWYAQRQSMENFIVVKVKILIYLFQLSLNSKVMFSLIR